MKKHQVLIIILLAVVGLAQPRNLSSQPAANIQSVRTDVQLMVSLRNSVLLAGSTIPVKLQIVNSSTNTLTTGPSKPGVPIFTMSLIKADGNRSHPITITPDPEPITTVLPLINISAGETKVWDAQVALKKEIAPGDYLLMATLRLGLNGPNYIDPNSNYLKVRVE